MNNKSGCGEGIPRLNNGIMLQLANLKELRIGSCSLLEHVFPYSSALESLGKLEYLGVFDCKVMTVIVKEEGDGEQLRSKVVVFPRLKSIYLEKLPEFVGFLLGMNERPPLKMVSAHSGLNFQLPNLKVLKIEECDLLEHVFTFSAVESLRQLQELTIQKCKSIKVIVKEEEQASVVVFPCLKSIQLLNLPNLVGFFLGMNDFQLPLLDKVTIENCPQMVVFTSAHQLTAPKLKYVQTGVGTYSLDQSCGLNFHVKTTTHHQAQIPLQHSNGSEGGVTWSYTNLIELDVRRNFYVEKIIPSNELLQLQKLEKIFVWRCDLLVDVFEAFERTSSGSDASKTIVKLPNLRQVDLASLYRLRYIWKSNQWTLFEFPNLTRLSIERCHMLEHVFNSSMLGSLLQLQELHIRDCKHMEEVIVKDTNAAVDEEEEEEDGKMNEILVLPRLKSLVLEKLPCLKGFCLGKDDFSLPLLDTLTIKKCPAITIFTNGRTATPELIEIETGVGLFYVEEDINSFIKAKQEELKS